MLEGDGTLAIHGIITAESKVSEAMSQIQVTMREEE